MIRFVLILLSSILLITVVRSILGIVMKGVADFLGGGTRAAGSNQPTARQDIPLSGELKRDPVCGTFISTATSTKKTVDGQILHFCSVECRDKHKV